MIDLKQFSGFRQRRLSTLLGLELDGSRLDGVVVRRTNGSVQVLKSFSVVLSLDPLTADPELVGREIRNHLDALGVRERTAAVCVPLKWALTAHTEMPDLAEEDVPGFLEIEAERGFHSDVETLHYATSRYAGAGGKRFVTLVGIPRNQVALLERVLRAAKLKPISFSLGIAALQPPTDTARSALMTLSVGERNVELQITGGGGIVALRAFEGALEVEGSRRILHAEVVAREARITLGQLPAEIRDSIKRVRIFGPRDLAQQLADELDLRLEKMGIEVEVVTSYSAKDFGVQLPADAPVSAAFSLATQRLAGGEPPLEFLPPYVPAWQQMASRYTSGKTRTALTAAAAVLVIAAVLFGFQQWRIIRLESQWEEIADRAAEVQALQDQIQKYRPWFDDSLRGLAILRELTQAFPEEGSVSARTVEIRDLNQVTCTGVARDNQALLGMLNRLRQAQGVTDVKVNQIRGRSPMQFTFDFRWQEGAQRAN